MTATKKKAAAKPAATKKDTSPETDPASVIVPSDDRVEVSGEQLRNAEIRAVADKRDHDNPPVDFDEKRPTSEKVDVQVHGTELLLTVGGKHAILSGQDLHFLARKANQAAAGT